VPAELVVVLIGGLQYAKGPFMCEGA